VGESLQHQGVRFIVEQADERRVITVLAWREEATEEQEPVNEAEA
jgi:CBS domain containing-hemolysin-like protein